MTLSGEMLSSPMKPYPLRCDGALADVTGNDLTQMQMNVHAGRLAVF